MASILDNLDQRLIQELKTDVRTPYTVLSRKLGVSSRTVRRRLQRLLEDRVLSLEMMPHPHKLGYHVTTFMGFRLDLAKADQAASQLASNPEFVFLSTTLGFYDVVGYAAFRSHEHIADFMEQRAAQIEGIESSETLIVVRHCKHSWYGVVAGDPPKEEFDALDRQIVGALRDDVRASWASLSERLGVGIPTVRERVKQMLRVRDIICAPSIDPSKAGYGVIVTIGIRCKLTHVTEVRSTLEANEQVHGLSMVTGRFDFILWTYFRDSQRLTTFIRKDLSSIRGIEHYDVLFHSGILKWSWTPAPAGLI